MVKVYMEQENDSQVSDKDKNVSDTVADMDPTKFNVESIAQLEHQAMHERSADERISDFITRSIGNLKFLSFHVMLLAVWMVINFGLLPNLKPFDPFPFGILTLIVSAEGIFLTIFVLISQNRMSRQAERRNQLDLQISMLAEQELTMILRLQQKLCEHFGIAFGGIEREAQQFMKKTNVERLVKEIEEQLPGE
ncbi:MAG: DUF1003 domain-containing protein [Pyrinomonadaceae bacterium]